MALLCELDWEAIARRPSLCVSLSLSLCPSLSLRLSSSSSCCPPVPPPPSPFLLVWVYVPEGGAWVDN